MQRTRSSQSGSGGGDGSIPRPASSGAGTNLEVAPAGPPPYWNLIGGGGGCDSNIYPPLTTRTLPLPPSSAPTAQQRATHTPNRNPNSLHPPGGRPRSSSNLPNMMLLSFRDKESLVEEIMFLRKALSQLHHQYKTHKGFTTCVEEENRKLEQEVDCLERKKGQDAPRTGGPSKLKVKLQGIKSRVMDLQKTCNSQYEELTQLHRDVAVTRVRELEVEKEVFGEELKSLQKYIRRLNSSHVRISHKISESGRVKEKNICLEHAVKRFGISLAAANENLETVNGDLAIQRGKASESAHHLKKIEKNCKEMMKKAAHLEEKLDKERSEKLKVQKKIHSLEGEMQLKMNRTNSHQSRTEPARRGGKPTENNNNRKLNMIKNRKSIVHNIISNNNSNSNRKGKGKSYKKSNLTDMTLQGYLSSNSILKFLKKLSEGKQMKRLTDQNDSPASPRIREIS